MRLLLLTLVLSSAAEAQIARPDTGAPVYVVFATLAGDSSVTAIAQRVDSGARALLVMTSRVVPMTNPLARPRSHGGGPVSVRLFTQMHVRRIGHDSIVVRWRLVNTETGVLDVQDSIHLAPVPSDAALDRASAAVAYSIGRAARPGARPVGRRARRQ